MIMPIKTYVRANGWRILVSIAGLWMGANYTKESYFFLYWGSHTDMFYVIVNVVLFLALMPRAPNLPVQVLELSGIGIIQVTIIFKAMAFGFYDAFHNERSPDGYVAVSSEHWILYLFGTVQLFFIYMLLYGQREKLNAIACVSCSLFAGGASISVLYISQSLMIHGTG